LIDPGAAVLCRVPRAESFKEELQCRVAVAGTDAWLPP
jgi:hypothetical protein